MFLTLGLPHGFDDVKFHHEDDSRNDDRSEGCTRNKVEVRGEKLQRENHKHAWNIIRANLNSIILNKNITYFIELKHTIQIASQYKEAAQLDTEKGIARTGPASKKKQHKKKYKTI
jgi:hypothetical protein